MYVITQEQRDRYNANRRAKKAAETPEQKEERLKIRRAKEKARLEAGGETLRKRIRAAALDYVHRRVAENPNYHNDRYLRSKRRKQVKAEQLAATMQEDERLCPVCLSVRKLTDFPRTRTGERAALCVSCFRTVTGQYDIRERAYWAKKAGSIKQRVRRRAPEGTRIDEITPEDLMELYEKQAHKCAYCGIELNALITAVDHKTPISKGGEHTLKNLQLLCHNCNISKFTMTDAEYREYFLNSFKGPSRSAPSSPDGPLSTMAMAIDSSISCIPIKENVHTKEGELPEYPTGGAEDDRKPSSDQMEFDF